jgi:acyl-CoA hydrolase
MARRAKVVLAEVVPDQIRTYGENYIHVSEIDRFVEHSPPPLPPQFADLDLAGLLNKFGMVLTDEEEARIAEVIGETIAADIIRDGDCIQVGGGSVSGTMCAFLHNKHDLGIHSEVIPGGTADLVKEGVITGNRKSINRGKVVGTALSGLSPEELGFFNENPVLELYDITKINHPRVISQNDNVVAINNALSIDLTGQVNAASFGTRMFTSAGGQPDFLMGALWSHGGRAITVLPATGKKGTVSRIVPILEPGTEVAVSRYFVDHVVTEYGIAKLFGKTRKERVEELIAVAHPDFRAELRKEAQKLSWI